MFGMKLASPPSLITPLGVAEVSQLLVDFPEQGQLDWTFISIRQASHSIDHT